VQQILGHEQPPPALAGEQKRGELPLVLDAFFAVGKSAGLWVENEVVVKR
jgi:hypothetical protein